MNTEQQQQRNKQLALFGVIVAETVINPTIFAGIAYWLTKNKSFQSIAVFIGAFIGLGIGFYRIYLVQKRLNQHEPPAK